MSEAGSMISEPARQLLERPGLLGVICTVRPGGRPQANPLWFRLDGAAIRIWTDQQRRWVANLDDHPHVAFSVHENQRPWASVSIRGRARLERAGLDWTIAEIRRISARYLNADEIAAYVDAWPQTRSIVTIEPDAVFIAEAFADPVAHRRP